MPRRELPRELRERPFTIHAGHEAGLGRGRLAGGDLRSPTRGVRSAAEVHTVPQQAWTFALVLPGDVAFSHVTAARVWGLPLPAGLEDDSRPLDVMRHSRRSRIRRRGCRGHEGLELRVCDTVRQIRVTAMPDTWVDLAGNLAMDRGATESLSADDLVVVGDQVALRLRSVEPLREAVERRPRVYGRATLEPALDLIRVGSRSPMESRCRLMFARAGLPDPEVDVGLSDELGGWLETCDFVWRRQRVIGEYQGEVHAPLEARDIDNQRRQLAEDEGWTVIEIFKRDVTHGSRRIACLTRFARALGCDPGSLRLE